MWTCCPLHDLGKHEPLAHDIIPDEHALIIFVSDGAVLEGPGGMRTRCAWRQWGSAYLGPTVCMDQPFGVPCSPDGRRGRGGEGHTDCELGRKAGAIIGIRYHREILCHIDAGDENRSDIAAMFGGELYPGIIMFLHVFFEHGLMFYVFPIGVVSGDQCRSPFLGEFKRKSGSRFQYPCETMSVAEVEFSCSHRVVLNDAPRSAPVSLTEFVRRQPGNRG